MHKLIITKPVSSSKTVIIVAIIAGLIASIIINNISRWLNVWNSLWGLAVAFVVFVVMGLMIEYTAPTDTKFKKIIQYVGIALAAIAPGVIVDVALDFFVRHYDRNLFPFEIIMWWVFAPLPLMAGVLLARGLFEFKTKDNNG